MNRQPTHRAWRPAALLLAFAICVAAICFRLYQLQVRDHPVYARRAKAQSTATVKVPAPRGPILDRNGVTLAVSIPAVDVVINPVLPPDPPVAAALLAPLLDLPQEELKARIASARQAGKQYLVVKPAISALESERLRSLNLSWIHLVPTQRRVYPNGRLASHVLGGIRSDGHGSFGIELAMDRQLAGVDGKVRVLWDAFHRPLDSTVLSPPRQGAGLTLTLDSRIQYVAEQALERAVISHRAVSGSVVVMDPETGDILALASYPSFDPNQPISSAADFSARENHAVSVPFEPGSVFKVITMAAALETTPIRPDTIVPCGNGTMNLYGRIIRDHKAYSFLNASDVLAKSSNIGIINIGLRVGPANLAEYIRRFGFGRRTGLPLPGESPGKVRDLSAWQRTSIGSVAMGHEISTTTVQLAQAMAAIANGGRLIKPRLVLARHYPGRPPVVDPPSSSLRVLKPETSVTLRRMLERVVLEGTGTQARMPGYSSGGKTGSAQIYDHACRCYRHGYYNSSFAGFAPVSRPAVVTVVTINGAPVFGGVIAAPVFREVTAAALRLLSIPKDLPDAPPPREEVPETVNDLALADLGPPTGPLAGAETPDRPSSPVVFGPQVPDFYGKTVRSVLEESAHLGLPVEISGSGLARSQFPPPGTVLPEGGKVRVQFAR